MGVLNVTPDSFSDGGRWSTLDGALRRGSQLLHDGADILDVGGESTRPGAEPVTVDEELNRVIPVITELHARHPEARLSIDTRRAEVAEAAVAAGASIINDVSCSLGLVAGHHGVDYLAMHMRGDPRWMQDNPVYEDVVSEVKEQLCETAVQARANGCLRVWIDPGIGFGKGHRHNLELIRRIGEFVNTEWPVALGISRKSFLGALTAAAQSGQEIDSAGIVEVQQRQCAGIVTTTFAAINRVALIRVHDVAAHVAALDAIRIRFMK